MRRHRRYAAVLAIATVLVAGCGRDTDGGQDEARSVAAGKAKGEITVWAMGTEGEKLSDFAKAFTAENPDAKVTVTAVPWDAAHQKIASAIAAKQTPDVSMLGTTWMGEFAKTGALDPTPTDLIRKDDFFPGAWATGVVGGTAYAVPWYVETRLIFYRKDLAQAAGITSPPKTWEELTAMARALKEKAGAESGLYLQPGGTGSWQSFLPFAWSNGAELTKDNKFTLDSAQMSEALQYYGSFFKEKLSTTTDLGVQGSLEQSFVTGKTGAFISGPWHIGLLSEQGGAGFTEKFGVVRMPTRKSSTSFIGGSNLAVFKDGHNRDGAWKFIEWLSRPEVQVRWYRTVTSLPAVQKSWDDPSLAGDPFLSEFGEQLKSAKAPPPITTWEQVASAVDAEIERVAKAGADSAAATKAMQERASSIGTGT
ncbi:sugar ABC transporter substrate-binding protein [Virgisporangium aliadipatigenens]|uniref:Sugar ABC transporter substrate-binding protein n=1 Tax=Virgisporangium aliadipatigenens TaxID=741659 RepID=A0A8J3YE01_9ACTN|nr:sugar ABC transporter substrate-binding protein [Virgisporangium aliadipatigenens]GIJ43339.1 sugar ABC transporter substrate-binding protein [Virgisporangium aliadipatigenens]